MQRGFEEIGAENLDQLDCDVNTKLQTLLDPTNPQRLMYSLYVVEGLCRTAEEQLGKSCTYLVGVINDSQFNSNYLLMNLVLMLINISNK